MRTFASSLWDACQTKGGFSSRWDACQTEGGIFEARLLFATSPAPRTPNLNVDVGGLVERLGCHSTLLAHNAHQSTLKFGKGGSGTKAGNVGFKTIVCINHKNRPQGSHP